MEFDRRDIPMNKLVVTGLESKFSVFDMRTQHPTKGFASLTESVSSFLSEAVTSEASDCWYCHNPFCA